MAKSPVHQKSFNQQYSSQTTKKESGLKRSETSNKFGKEFSHRKTTNNMMRPGTSSQCQQKLAESSILLSKHQQSSYGLNNVNEDIDSFFDDVSIQIMDKDVAQSYNTEQYAFQERKNRNQRLKSIANQIAQSKQYLLQRRQKSNLKSTTSQGGKEVTFGFPMSDQQNNQSQIKVVHSRHQQSEGGKTFITKLDNQEDDPNLISPQRAFLDFVKDKLKNEDNDYGHQQVQESVQEQEEEEVNFAGLLRDVISTQKKLADLTQKNDMDELNELFNITKKNLSTYKGFMHGIKNNLHSLNKDMIKCESSLMQQAPKSQAPSPTSYLMRKASLRKLQCNPSNKSAYANPTKLSKQYNQPSNNHNRPTSAAQPLVQKHKKNRYSQYIQQRSSSLLSNIISPPNKRVDDSDNATVFYGASKENEITLTHQIPERVRAQVISNALMNKQKIEQINSSKQNKPNRKLAREQSSSVQLVKSLQRINNEIQLFSKNLETNCKENLKQSYHNLKNYENKAVGIGFLAQHKMQKHLKINESSTMNKKLIESSSALLMDPLFMNQEESDDDEEEGEGHHSSKIGFIRQRPQYEHQMRFQHQRERKPNLVLDDNEEEEQDDIEVEVNQSKHLESFYRKITDKIRKH